MRIYLKELELPTRRQNIKTSQNRCA